MDADVEQVLVGRDEIARRIREMAEEITRAHRAAAGAAELTILPVLTGAMIFCADLIRQLPIKLRIELLGVSSYPGRSLRSQGPSLVRQQVGDIAGKHLLLVDDILDSGGTLKMLRPMLEGMNPASLRLAVLLRKDRPEAREVSVDHVGFEIPDVFVAGYGLDFDGCYRNLPEIVALKPAIMSGSPSSQVKAG